MMLIEGQVSLVSNGTKQELVGSRERPPTLAGGRILTLASAGSKACSKSLLTWKMLGLRLKQSHSPRRQCDGELGRGILKGRGGGVAFGSSTTGPFEFLVVRLGAA